MSGTKSDMFSTRRRKFERGLNPLLFSLTFHLFALFFYRLVLCTGQYNKAIKESYLLNSKNELKQILIKVKDKTKYSSQNVKVPLKLFHYKQDGGNSRREIAINSDLQTKLS